MTELYVATIGSDQNPGTIEKPFATLARAQATLRELRRTNQQPITVLVRGGIYYLEEPLTIEPVDSGTAEAPTIFTAYPGEIPVLSGGRRLECRWQPYQASLMRCYLPEVKSGQLDFTQLFVNGKR